ncbi:MAG: Small heat shock protein [uncultured bacterium]|nr:MAG: Small heat shock protein [uncultured bacterium]HBD05183.1 hypothetical protein [Candidatus Uhrbacteria bacterium]
MENEWLTQQEEGQLSVDVLEGDKEIVIRSAIAGVKPKDLDVYITHDMVTIKGERKVEEHIDNPTYHYQECHFGAFSRSIVLPCPIKPDEAQAELKDGILTIRLPKTKTSASLFIKEVE